MTARTWFFLVVVLATLARIGFVMEGEVLPENAYYHLCSEHPAPAYFDGPAGTAFSIRAASVFGGHWWMVLGPLWAAAASLACWRLGVRLAGETGGVLGAIALNALPAFNQASLACGPQMPALALGLAGLSLLWDSGRMQHAGTRAWIGILVAAVAFGTSSLFSYNFAFAGLFAAAAPLFRTTGRKPVHWAGLVFVFVAVAIALAAPLAWNARNAWIPMAGWTPRALLGFDLATLASGSANLILGLSPIFALGMVWAAWKTLRESRKKSADTFVLMACLPGFLTTMLATYRGWDPASEALLPAAILLPTVCAAMVRSVPVLAAAVLLAVALSVPVLLSPMSASAPRMASEHLLELDQRLSPDLPGGLFFIADDPALASTLAYHLRDAVIPPQGHPRVYVRESQDISNQFALWPSYDDFVETQTPPDEFFEELSAANPFLGRSAIYVGHEDPAHLPQSIHSAFAVVELVQEIGGLFIYLCLDYQTMPL